MSRKLYVIRKLMPDKHASRCLVGLLLLALCAAAPMHAQEYTPYVVSARHDATLYEGPGDTFFPRGVLGAGIAVAIIERNELGNWLYIEHSNSAGIITLSGWMMSGYLNLDDTVHFSEVP
ncbi:MAG: hypothetical protein U0694_10165, partial [Anaerolineae bacterium]